jgi:hypothetical protein
MRTLSSSTTARKTDIIPNEHDFVLNSIFNDQSLCPRKNKNTKKKNRSYETYFLGVFLLFYIIITTVFFFVFWLCYCI